MAFRFSTNGLRLDDETYGLLKKARQVGLHGDVQFVKALANNRFEVTTASRGVIKLSGNVRLSNMLTKDMQEEPKRRIEWKANHPIRPMEPVESRSGVDERTVPERASDEDARHHRTVRGRW